MFANKALLHFWEVLLNLPPVSTLLTAKSSAKEQLMLWQRPVLPLPQAPCWCQAPAHRACLPASPPSLGGEFRSA